MPRAAGPGLRGLGKMLVQGRGGRWGDGASEASPAAPTQGHTRLWAGPAGAEPSTIKSPPAGAWFTSAAHGTPASCWHWELGNPQQTPLHAQSHSPLLHPSPAPMSAAGRSSETPQRAELQSEKVPTGMVSEWIPARKSSNSTPKSLLWGSAHGLSARFCPSPLHPQTRTLNLPQEFRDQQGSAPHQPRWVICFPSASLTDLGVLHTRHGLRGPALPPVPGPQPALPPQGAKLGSPPQVFSRHAKGLRLSPHLQNLGTDSTLKCFLPGGRVWGVQGCRAGCHSPSQLCGEHHTSRGQESRDAGSGTMDVQELLLLLLKHLPWEECHLHSQGVSSSSSASRPGQVCSGDLCGPWNHGIVEVGRAVRDHRVTQFPQHRQGHR